MNIGMLMGQAGLYSMGLLALTVVALENTVEAQPLKPPNSSEQALRKAAFEGQSVKVRSLLDKGAMPDAPDPDGRTALMLASFNGHKETVYPSWNILNGRRQFLSIFRLGPQHSELFSSLRHYK